MPAIVIPAMVRVVSPETELVTVTAVEGAIMCAGPAAEEKTKVWNKLVVTIIEVTGMNDKTEAKLMNYAFPTVLASRQSLESLISQMNTLDSHTPVTCQ